MERGLIEVRGLSKKYGDTVAVRNLSFTVPAGTVTGFLGPNGAGKSTTMRMIAGLDTPSSGSVLVNGRNYRHAKAPMAELGMLLEARSVHSSRSAFNHLLALARSNGVRRRRVDEVIEQVGLRDVAGKRAGKFSLGMGQRLGIAVALLGDPRTVVLDEPINGLDPDGIRWVRLLLQDLAAQGRTVFLSSHLMSEMAQTAQRLIVIGRGKLIADTTVAEFTARASDGRVLVRSPQATELAEALVGPGVSVEAVAPGELAVRGLSTERIGTVACEHRIVVHQLNVAEVSLEEAFMALTAAAVEYSAERVGGPR
jgi:ABC-2 type transport system ATP-binding protein